MNRLAVYSYLTRYTYWHPGSGRPFTKREPSRSQEAGARRQAGPPFQDLTSGWKQPESDNDTANIGTFRSGYDKKNGIA